jgi:tetratricopeptide (TPR) repeat protein
LLTIARNQKTIEECIRPEDQAAFKALIKDRREYVDRFGKYTEEIRNRILACSEVDNPENTIAKIGFYLCGRAEIKARDGRYEEAVADYSEAIQLVPEYQRAFYGLGQAEANLGHHRAAIAAYSRAVDIDPKDYMAFYGLGQAHVTLGNDIAAITAYSKAIGVCPECYWTLFARGAIYAKHDLYAEAIADFDKAIEISPFADFHNARGQVKAKLGQDQEAIQDFSKAASMQPAFAQAYLNRALALERIGLKDEAITDYLTVAQLNPRLIPVPKRELLVTYLSIKWSN